MARLVSDFRIHSKNNGSPEAVLKTMNEILVERGRRGMFVTLQYALLDVASGKVSYASGGHLPLLWLHANGLRGEYMTSGGGAPLGITRDTRFIPRTIQLQSGDYLVSFTDGIVEAKNSEGKQYAMEQLSKKLKRQWSSPQELVDFVIQDVQNFTDGTHPHDDLTIIALRWGKD
jgi:sigma-B regulation protein RsbU (phosphoserine phosphatase)